MITFKTVNILHCRYTLSQINKPSHLKICIFQFKLPFYFLSFHKHNNLKFEVLIVQKISHVNKFISFVLNFT